MPYITKSNTRLILIKNLCLSTYFIHYLMLENISAKLFSILDMETKFISTLDIE